LWILNGGGELQEAINNAEPMSIAGHHHGGLLSSKAAFVRRALAHER
jgi:hypothetical protein